MTLLRIGVRVLAALLAVVALAAVVVLAHGWQRLHRTVPNRLRPLVVAPDSSLVARGEHIAATNCAGCHSSEHTPPLRGGNEDFLAIPNGPTFGSLFASNLTPGGRLAQYTDEQLARAIREGVGRDGKPLLVMPSVRFHDLSDRDVAALIAFLRSQPAVDHATPPRRVDLLGYLILGLHVFPPSDMPEVRGPQDAPAEGATAEYGAYLARYLTCQDCHGESLRGGKKGQLPPVGPDLVALAAAHSRDDFDRALRHGTSARDGHSLDPQQMPYWLFAHLTDTEVDALYAVLKSGGL